MPRRLKVIDGADQGHNFWLPETGTLLVGSNSKHCDIVLHDLYVSRVHCHLEIEGKRILVRPMALLLIIVFAVKLDWLPASGWVSPLDDPIGGLKHLVLPVFSLGLFGSASIMRQTRISCSLGRPSRLIKPPGMRPPAYVYWR